MTGRVPWLRAAIVGPAVGVTIFVTSSVLVFGWIDPKFGGRFANWVLGMGSGGLLALLTAAALLSVDLLLLRMRLRRLPAGRRAFGAGVAAPMLAFAIYRVVPPGDFDFGPRFVAAVVVPLVTIALTLRLFLGEPFEEGGIS